MAYRNFHRLRFDVFYQVFRSCHNIISITIPLQSHALHFPFLPLAILLIPLRHTIITSAMNGPAGHARDLPLSVTASTSPHTIPASASSIHPTNPSSQFHSQNQHSPSTPISQNVGFSPQKRNEATGRKGSNLRPSPVFNHNRFLAVWGVQHALGLACFGPNTMCAPTPSTLQATYIHTYAGVL